MASRPFWRRPAFRFRGAVRLVWSGSIIVALGATLWTEPTFTDCGHLCAAVIGLAAGAAASLFRHRLERTAAQTDQETTGSERPRFCNRPTTGSTTRAAIGPSTAISRT